jgi:hypothetical protein
MFCNKCGKEMDDNSKFCMNCGEQTTPGAAAPTQPVQQAPGYTPVQPFQQYSSVNPNQPQYQQTFFNGQQASVGTSGQVQFKNGGKKKKGCLIAVIAVIIVAVLAIAGIALLGGSSEVKNLQMASEVDEQTNLPIVSTSVFNPESPVIFCTFEANVEPGTLVAVEWWYVDDAANEEFVTSYELETEFKGDQVSFSWSRPDNGWPLGKYQARIFVNDKQVETARFEVK